MRQDKQGNKIYLHDDGVYLKLITDVIPKKIFSFNGGRIIKYVKKSNIMKKPYSAIGFNYYALLELQNAKFVKRKEIYIRLGKKYYKIPIETILQKKEFFHFKSQGYELQCFYPMASILKLEVNSKGNYKETQENGGILSWHSN